MSAIFSSGGSSWFYYSSCSLQAGQFLESLRGSPDYPERVNTLAEGPVLAMELVRQVGRILLFMFMLL